MPYLSPVLLKTAILLHTGHIELHSVAVLFEDPVGLVVDHVHAVFAVQWLCEVLKGRRGGERGRRGGRDEGWQWDLGMR